MDLVTRAEAEAYIESFGELPAGGVSPDIITDVSSRMAEYTGRKDWGEQESRTEYYDGGTQYLAVDYWPIASVASIYDDTDHVWDSGTLIDSDSYYVSSKDDGVIYFEYDSPLKGRENVKVTYTAGYDGTANVPSRLKTAANMQIRYEVERNTPGRFTNVPGQFASAEFADFEGLGLLGEVRALLNRYKRMVPFAC